MAAVVTGTPIAVDWGTSADPTGQSITIPADCTAVYVFWRGYNETTPGGVSTITLAAAAPDEILDQDSTTSPAVAWIGVAAWYNPSTGSQTLDVAWDVAPARVNCTVIYVKDGDTAGWRDADQQGVTGSNTAAITLRDWIDTNFPRHTDGSVAVQEWSASTNYIPVDKTFSSAQLATFRTNADAFIATVG